MTNKDVLKILNKVGENFGWQIGSVPTNYVNGYMQAIRDCKAEFYKDDIVEVNKKIDLAEVTRCKDCKYRIEGYCETWSYCGHEKVGDTDFCSYGEKVE